MQQPGSGHQAGSCSADHIKKHQCTTAPVYCLNLQLLLFGFDNPGKYTNPDPPIKTPKN
ncbi:hypothetical protein CLV42_10979 [Chitinophaga ginsengisoli]|uniref:Uncharacterized protein n=1 Tax=Chitinophaga ginsengisoli TaxID=363837 RepID=A0A2P8G0X3_9BACT|nr:hypothetical protein CLV42_10979 [Chitinophaga ginsengisoli]